ncbi:tetratricopeptide repeat protein [Solitalea sp. MAHUQ-68]|uniref:Tetratricopeptide repeat protein n=1 Tax=Solitalea agri TaxID=2953739 RepID=A0A9X2JDP8_9SPHI|nr:tetratricopeptide repeat protein [Solitalea agri]MCO4293140.1 tetratricopeptide repeat protein [Solitalea agri]
MNASFGQTVRKGSSHHNVSAAGRVLTSSDSAKVKYYFLNGLREKTLGETNNAIRNFLLCLDIDNTNDAAYYELALAYQILEQNESAIIAIEKAIQYNKEQLWYYQLKASLQQQLEMFGKAADTYSMLISLSPKNEEFYYNQANALIFADRIDEALSVYYRIEKLFGYSDELVLQRQRVYLKKGDLHDAVKEMEELIKRNPDDIRYYLMTAELYESNNLYDKALEKYQQAMKVAPDNGYLHLALADYYKVKGNKTAVFEAVKRAFVSDEVDFESKVRILYNNYTDPNQQSVRNETLILSNILIDKYPHNAQVYSIRADLMLIQDKKKEACVLYKKSLENDKSNYAVWEQLARVQLGLGDFKEVVATTTVALGYFPDKVLLYLFDGIAKAQTGNNKGAIESYTKGLVLSKDSKELSAQFYGNIGDSYHSIGNYPESDNAYESSLLLDYNNALVLNNYAYYLSLRGKDLLKAEKMARRAIQLEPNNTSYEDTYGWVLYRLERYQEAKMWIEKALSNNMSKSATLVEHYGDVMFKLGNKDEALSYWKKAKEYGSKSELLEKKINDQALHE